MELLLRGEVVLRWSWLKDRQEHLAKQLQELLKEDAESTVNALLESIEYRVRMDASSIEGPRKVKAAVLQYSFRYFPSGD